MIDEDEIIMTGFEDDEPIIIPYADATLEQTEAAAREAYRSGDNTNPFIITPSGLTEAQLLDWEEREEAWAEAWIHESRK